MSSATGYGFGLDWIGVCRSDVKCSGWPEPLSVLFDSLAFAKLELFARVVMLRGLFCFCAAANGTVLDLRFDLKRNAACWRLRGTG